MRYGPEHKAATRERILETAGAAAKRSGFAATGVNALADAADLTAGALYNHFGSKSGLLSALVSAEMSRSRRRFKINDQQELLDAVDQYLSMAHVAQPERGCMLPSMTAELAQANPEVRQEFEEQMLSIHDALAKVLGDPDKAWMMLSASVGGVMLARAMARPKSRKEVVNGARKAIRAVLVEQQTGSD